MRTLLVVLVLSFTSLSLAQQSPKTSRLPEGQNGIASRYPGDAGIERDQNVVFVENFNDDLAKVKSRWESVQDAEILSLSTDTPQGSAGKSSLLITHVGGRGSGAHLYRQLKPGYDKLHYRFYVKFDEQCGPIHHFFHVGGYNPATAWPQGGAGERPRGDERFTTGVEPFGNSWQWDCYSYWMEMRGSPPRGQCWGNKFVQDPSAKAVKRKWQCLELMMKVNSIGETNGEMALWLDGRLLRHLRPGAPQGKWVYDKFLPGEGGDGVRWNDETKRPEYLTFPEEGDPFEGFRWRSDPDLKLNFLWLLCYITKSPQGHTSQIWFDDIVVAKEYIGPITEIN